MRPMFVEALVAHEGRRALVAETQPLTIRVADTGGSCSLAAAFFGLAAGATFLGLRSVASPW